MQKTLIITALAIAASAASGSSSAAAPDFPSKPIRIVTAETGGGNDVAARLIAQGLSIRFGKQVIVDNRGGSVIVAADIVRAASPDGYTLMLYGNNFWILPFMRDHVSYDPVKDFSPVTLATSSPSVLVVHPAVPAKSTRELIALAKAKPGQLNYGAASGGTIHIAAELFKSLAGVNIVNVPYKGGGPALTALMSGEIQVMFPTAGTVAAQLHSNKLRALAVTSAKPSVLFPDLPTIADSGLPGYEAVARFAVFGPAKTPKAINSLLSREIVNVLNQSDVKEKFRGAGIETVGSTPEQLASIMKAEMAGLGKVIRDAGIRAN